MAPLAKSFVGCDIDADNVDWCAAHLPGRYHHTALQPPLPFPDAAFDLIYGVSVFTHLREPLQDAWLAELRRVLKPRGVAMMTVHGETAIEFAGLKPKEYVAMKEAVRKDGIQVSSENEQLNGAVDEPREYVNVFHNTEYVRRRWGKVLPIAAIVPGYIYTHDLVILAKR